MAEISLLNPQNSKAVFKSLTKESINDLSLDFICKALTKSEYEQNVIMKIMTEITDDAETVKYRGDVFDDFLRFPKLRDSLAELLEELNDLRDISRFQKDTEASSLWKLINRLREIDGYVNCITKIKECLESLDIKSEGLLTLKKEVTDIYANSGFPQLKADINETFAKVQKVKSITIGVNLDDLLRPKNAGILSLNDKAFTSSGLMQHFMKFTNNGDEIHFGTDISDIKKFHPSSPKFKENDIGIGTLDAVPTNGNPHITSSGLTGADPLSDSLKKAVTDIMRKTVRDIQSVLTKYVNISGYTLSALMPEIVFYIRWAELVEKSEQKDLLCASPKSCRRKTERFLPKACII